MQLQSIGPVGKTPAEAAAAAGALDCLSYQPELPNPGGPLYEVHLLVPADRVDAARAAVATFGASHIVTAAPGAFSTPPETTLPSGTDPLPC